MTTLCQAPYTHYLIWFSQHCCGPHIYLFILQMKKLRLGEFRYHSKISDLASDGGDICTWLNLLYFLIYWNSSVPDSSVSPPVSFQAMQVSFCRLATNRETISCPTWCSNARDTSVRYTEAVIFLSYSWEWGKRGWLKGIKSGVFLFVFVFTCSCHGFSNSQSGSERRGISGIPDCNEFILRPLSSF